MPKFQPSDDGKTIDGKVVVFLPTGPTQQAGGPGLTTAPPPAALPTLTPRQTEQAAKGQAAALAAAAKDGIPFCEECQRARQEQAGRSP